MLQMRLFLQFKIYDVTAKAIYTLYTPKILKIFKGKKVFGSQSSTFSCVLEQNVIVLLTS